MKQVLRRVRDFLQGQENCSKSVSLEHWPRTSSIFQVCLGNQCRFWYHWVKKPREFLQVDPASLHLPGSRRDGADPAKSQRQVAKHGTSIEGMPPPEIKRGSDGELVIYDGVTRATRAAKYLPG